MKMELSGWPALIFLAVTIGIPTYIRVSNTSEIEELVGDIPQGPTHSSRVNSEQEILRDFLGNQKSRKETVGCEFPL